MTDTHIENVKSLIRVYLVRGDLNTVLCIADNDILPGPPSPGKLIMAPISCPYPRQAITLSAHVAIMC